MADNTETLRALSVRRGGGAGAHDRVRLDYDARFVRRKRLITEAGRPVLVDLPETVSLDDGDGLVLSTGAVIAIEAASEPLLRVEGPHLPRLAWHIGNRHTPCAIAQDHLLIRADPVLARMLVHLGARVTETHAPFAPEGGAYGHGRTLSHSHGEAEGGAYCHDHSHDHHHPHDHPHDHGDQPE